MTREVFMPLLCSDTSLNDQADKLMDIMHRIISQIAVTQSQIEVSTQLYTPSFILLSYINSIQGLGFIAITGLKLTRHSCQQPN